jgi:hypothetical protein
MFRRDRPITNRKEHPNSDRVPPGWQNPTERDPILRVVTAHGLRLAQMMHSLAHSPVPLQ